MPYDNTNSEYFISESSSVDDNSIRSVYFDDLSDSNSLFLSDPESGQSGYEYSVRGENEVDNTDYSDLIGSIDTNCSILVKQNQSLAYQLDILNNNVVTLNDNIKFGCGLVFTITFIVFIRTIFAVFNKVLGLNQA